MLCCWVAFFLVRFVVSAGWPAERYASFPAARISRQRLSEGVASRPGSAKESAVFSGPSMAHFLKEAEQCNFASEGGFWPLLSRGAEPNEESSCSVRRRRYLALVGTGTRKTVKKGGNSDLRVSGQKKTMALFSARAGSGSCTAPEASRFALGEARPPLPIRAPTALASHGPFPSSVPVG